MAIDWGAILETGGKALNTTGNYLGALGQQQALLNVARAYQDYLNGVSSQMADELTARADKYDNKLQALQQTGESQFVNEANTQLPELTQLVKDIATQSAEAQRQNRLQTQTELAQQGIRGGQAATLANRATGELNRNLQRDINQTVYNEAANRQNSRLNYYTQKGLVPYSAMSDAYGTSMVGANNALSNAQGRVYGDAYDLAMINFPRTQNPNNALTYGGTALNFLGGLGQLGGSVLSANPNLVNKIKTTQFANGAKGAIQGIKAGYGNTNGIKGGFVTDNSTRIS